jgi:CRISPR/Cas system-associated protein Csm6
MTKRIALAAALLLTLGTAAGAGSFFYAHDEARETVQITLPSDHEPASQQVTSEMIAMWKVTAASTDSEGTKAPI